jgi:beta-lactam-binding protein with PASTA domain
MTRIAALLGVIAIALAVAGGTRHEAAAKQVIVPNVIGIRGFAAQTTLERAGLQWRWDDGPAAAPSNSFFLADRIYGQTFAGEKVRRGTVILLTPASRKIVTLADLLQG